MINERQRSSPPPELLLFSFLSSTSEKQNSCWLRFLRHPHETLVRSEAAKRSWLGPTPSLNLFMPTAPPGALILRFWIGLTSQQQLDDVFRKCRAAPRTPLSATIMPLPQRTAMRMLCLKVRTGTFPDGFN